MSQSQCNVMPSLYDDFPLLEFTKTTRLLRIQPGNGTVCCDLEVVNLNQNPQFEAISYTWGSIDSQEMITLCGGRKSVTRNLGAALRRLRYQETERIVWIDALCVNQVDLDERSQQVQLMRDIFSAAWRVVVYLGEDYNGYAEKALRIIHKVVGYYRLEHGLSENWEKMLWLVCAREEPNSSAKEHRDLPILEQSGHGSDWDAVDWIYTNPWFFRVIGNSEVGWNIIRLAANWLYAKSYHTTSRSWSGRMHAMAMCPSLQNRHLLSDLFGSFINFEATDSRDKIYALMGLSVDFQGSGTLQPDYSMSVADVYRIFVRAIIRKNGSTNIFRYLRADSSPEFSSWTPRFDLGISASSNWLWSSRGSTSRAAKSTNSMYLDTDDKSCITLKGVETGMIRYVSHVLQEQPKNFEGFKALWETVKEIVGSGDESIETAFVQTVTAGAWGRGAIDSREPFRAEDLRAHLEKGASAPLKILTCFNFFITDNNRMGIGSVLTEVGDVVCVLYGGNLPSLLRPIRDYYRILENCYVYSIMNGEGLDNLEAGVSKEKWFSLK